MGGALLGGWMAHPAWRERISVLDPAANPGGVRNLAGPADLTALARPLTIVLAVKPDAVLQALDGVRDYLGPGDMVISIAAGVTLAALEGRSGGASLVRAMPNTPAAVRRGVTAAVASPRLTEIQRELCDVLFGMVGELVWLSGEHQIDAATAVSGSGPAYFFRLGEVLAEAGVRLGLEPETAARLAHMTLVGAGALAGESAEDLAVLRAGVTSPGGTTAAALAVFDDSQALAELAFAAAAAGAVRSRELSGAGALA